MNTSVRITSQEKTVYKTVLSILALFALITAQAYSQSWSPIGGGTNWEYSVVVYNNELYAGEQSGSGGHGLKKFDGTNWNDLGGINGTVNALVVYNGNLIVGGSFSVAGGVSVLNIAQWDGSTWSDVGGGPDNIVSALTVYNGNLIVGGYFTTVEGLNANYIAKYSGTSSWQTLGSGMGGSQGQVMALNTWNGHLIAGGFFTTAGGLSVNHIAQWDGSSWQAVGSGLNSIVYGLGAYNNNLVAGGLFTGCVAQWDGSAWSVLGNGCGGGFYPYVFAFASYGNDLYIGGLYTTAGGQTVNGISRWDGTSYHALGSGFYSGGSNVYGAYALTIFNNKLVAGGIFSTAGGAGCGNIAQWDGLALTGISNYNNSSPKGFSLSQNYPNPFNPSTTIKFSVVKRENVKLTVSNIIGQEVATIVNKNLDPGNYEVTWDASKISSGIYFYSITTPSFSETRKMILTK